MRLSLSGQHTGHEYSLKTALGEGVGDGQLPQGALLNEFIAAVCSRNDAEAAKSREKIRVEIGEAALVDVVAVIAAFNGYPRAADATGIPLEDYKQEATKEMRATLELDNLNLWKTLKGGQVS